MPDTETEWAAGIARRYEAWLTDCGACGTALARGQVKVAHVSHPEGERTAVRTAEEVRKHARGHTLATLVRRDGWTVPADDGRVDPDSIALILKAGNPGVRVQAVIGLDGSATDPAMEHTDRDGGWRRLHESEQGPGRESLTEAVRWIWNDSRNGIDNDRRKADEVGD